MSTLYSISSDLPAGTAVLQAGDLVPVYEASSGRTKSLTGAQIVSGASGVVALTAGATVLTVTQAAHAGRVVTIVSTTPIAITLPAATGTGARYEFVVLASATTTGHTIVTATSGETYKGFAILQTTSNAGLIFTATATDKTLTMNGGTQGGLIGAKIVLRDVASTKWSVEYISNSSGATATPFS